MLCFSFHGGQAGTVSECSVHDIRLASVFSRSRVATAAWLKACPGRLPAGSVLDFRPDCLGTVLGGNEPTGK